MISNASRRDVLAFCLAYLFSAFGYEFITFVMTVHIYRLTRDAFDVSLFMGLSFIPKLASPLFGAAGDRFGRARVLAAAALLAAGLTTCLAQTRAVAAIYLLWFLISACLMLISNLRGSLFADLLPGGRFHAGNSIMLTLANGARIVAPLLGGLAAVTMPVEALLYGIAVLYLAAAGMSLAIQTRPSGASAASTGAARSWLAGFRTIRDNPALRRLVGVSFLWRLFLGLQASLLIVYVKTYLNGDDAGYGLFMTLLSLGSLAGSLAGARLGRMRSEAVILAGLGLHYLTFAALGVIPAFAAACVTVFVSFLAFYAALVGMHSWRDRATPSDVRGRVYGSVTALITPAGIVSMLAGGYLAQVFGVQWVLAGAGLLAFVSLLLVVPGGKVEAAAESRSGVKEAEARPAPGRG